MPKPLKWRELVRRWRAHGWSPPESGGTHLAMWRNGRKLSIPKPHRGDIDWSLTKLILEQAQISRADWDATE